MNIFVHLFRLSQYVVFNVQCWLFLISHYIPKWFLISNHWLNQHLYKTFKWMIYFIIRQPPALPCRLQHSTIGRIGLNHRVRDGYGCDPYTHRHRKFSVSQRTLIIEQQSPLLFSLERRWSSRTFRYGYLVTTSPQLSAPPSAAPSIWLGHWLRAYPTPMVWRAVCTRPGNVFTATFWFAITSDSSFM